MLDIKVAAALAVRLKTTSHMGDDPGQVPWKGFLVAMLINGLLLPGLIYLIYTLYSVIPVLTIVEGDREYEAIPKEEDQEPEAAIEPPPDFGNKPVTNGIRNVHRLLWSVGGFRSLFWASPGFTVLIIGRFLLAILQKAVPIVPAFVADVVAIIWTLQLQTLWVHSALVGTGKKAVPVYVVDFRMAFRATAIPTLVACFAYSMAESVGVLAVSLLHVKMFKTTFPPPKDPLSITVETFAEDVEMWKMGVYIVVRYAFLAVFYVPAQAALVRVQASLLPAEKETIVKVDRTFGAEGVHELGHLTMFQAIQSMSHGNSWRRLYKMYAKVLLVGAVVEVLLCMLVELELLAFLYLK
ncbi:hypothetical protein G7054_g7482 [Neopestalotiopsis clavispora]|nr:hypothetical protein G7054_g7482 [Neopestalotiopsis clavispora]